MNIKHIIISTILASSLVATTNAADTIRFATFNASLEALNYTDRNQSQLILQQSLNNALSSPAQQVKNIVKIISIKQPDVILINEFDNGVFGKKNQVLFSELLKANGLNYPYFFQGPVNTGVLIDNGDKTAKPPANTQGFGYFPGHFGMLLLSKYPIDTEHIRTFQLFKWKDMPNALMPMNEDGTPWYADATWNKLRLSSKSHWDIPIKIDDEKVHVLASHPTPPVFDGKEDRNGKRNHDEIRFWHDYIDTNRSTYIYDDKSQFGGLKPNSRFVIMGDLNSSPAEGDSRQDAIRNLLNDTKVNDTEPKSLGAVQNAPQNPYAKTHTASWKMRVDYVLPSSFGLKVVSSGVFWPQKGEKYDALIKNRKTSSDHKLVWVDINITK
ncbi:endonuclease/exonuclease/phosphatase family protein [Thalassotalea agarivorans]|uniref:Endonuclease/Exonuclease/phosphatase family protein n=1 Tax=Thalassotalea agarivorans TaxID=349064 RepID=A0A1I0DDI2_THASX|nr:endonuclease/exonuclease/phosphatase family protein [Thalassotalea agarivorans]SET30405.1 Endonuclease/Exonuclease/phosphatase family protein [Thalassotalea agarivorans]